MQWGCSYGRGLVRLGEKLTNKLKMYLGNIHLYIYIIIEFNNIL